MPQFDDGVAMLYPSKVSGQSYVMPSDIFNRRGTNNKYDSGRIIVLGNEGEFEQVESGIVRLTDNGNVQLNIVTSKGYGTNIVETDRSILAENKFMQENTDWHNVEITIVLKYTGGSDLTSIILGTRTGLGKIDPCAGFSYKAGLILNGLSGFLSKQQYYPEGNDYRLFNTTKMGNTIKNKFIALKLCVYDLDSSGNPAEDSDEAQKVKLEFYGATERGVVAASTPTYVYDDLLDIYVLHDDGEYSPNGKFQMRYHGTNPVNGADVGETGVHVPSSPTGGFARVLYEAPYFLPNTDPDATSASIVVTDPKYYTDFDVTFYARTVAQLRTSPHAWECFWFMWHFNDAEGINFHHYYIALKSNGHVELGRKDNHVEAEEQYYLLAAEPAFTYSLNAWNKVRVRMEGIHIQVWIDDVLLIDMMDDGSLGAQSWAPNTPAVPSSQMASGRFAFYNEDAKVEVGPMTVTDLAIPTGGQLLNPFRLLKETVDDGGWGKADVCGGDAGQIGLWGGPVSTVEWRDNAGIQIQSLSVREIDPNEDFDSTMQPSSLTFIQTSPVEQSEENILSASVTDVSTGAVNDSLGVQQIYKTKPGGSVWISSKTGMLSDKQFSDNGYSIKSNGDGTYTVNGKSRIQSFSTKANADKGPDFDGYSTHNFNELKKRGAWDSPKSDWRDVEMTAYIKMEGASSSSSGDEVSWVTRSVRHNADSNSGCGGSSYHGNLHISGYPRFKKEDYHVSYQNDQLGPNGIGNVNKKTVGLKFISWNSSDNESVFLEIWLDKDNNNKWKKYHEKLDAGDWTTNGPDMKHCGALSDAAVISWASPKVIWKWNDPLKVTISKMSVREIIPEREDGTVPPPDTGGGGDTGGGTGGTGQLSRILTRYIGIYDVIVNSTGQTCAGAAPPSGSGSYTEIPGLTVTTITNEKPLAKNWASEDGRTRLGWYVTDNLAILHGERPTRVGVYLRKHGSPIGTLHVYIRDSSGNIKTEYGSGLDVSTLTTSYVLHETDFTNDDAPTEMGQGFATNWQLSVEWDDNSGDSSNYVGVGVNYNNPIDGGLTILFQYETEPGPDYAIVKQTSRDMCGKIYTSP